MSNKPFNSGRPYNERDICFTTLYCEMLKAKMRPNTVCRIVGIADHTMGDRLRGRSEWKLWEAVEIKKAIGSDMPLEELFKRD